MSLSLTNTDVAGTYRGAGGCCSPANVTMDVSACCGGGICIVQKCGGCPCCCFYACKCGENCWYHGSNKGLVWTSADELSDGCGTFTREKREELSTLGAPPAANIARA